MFEILSARSTSTKRSFKESTGRKGSEQFPSRWNRWIAAFYWRLLARASCIERQTKGTAVIFFSMEQRSQLPNNNRWIERFRRKYASATFLASLHAVSLNQMTGHSQLPENSNWLSLEEGKRSNDDHGRSTWRSTGISIARWRRLIVWKR